MPSRNEILNQARKQAVGVFEDSYTVRYKDTTTPSPALERFLKKEGVDITDIDTRLVSWLNEFSSAYPDLVSNLVVTSGREGEHSEGSAHYEGKALDIRITNKDNPWEDPLFKAMALDENRLKTYGISLVNPEHGSAPHIHLAVDRPTELASDVYYKLTGEAVDKNVKAAADLASPEGFTSDALTTLLASQDQTLAFNNELLNQMFLSRQKEVIEQDKKTKEDNEAMTRLQKQQNEINRKASQRAFLTEFAQSIDLPFEEFVLNQPQQS